MSIWRARNLIFTSQFLVIPAIIIIISAAISLLSLYEVGNDDHFQLMAQQQQPMNITTEHNLIFKNGISLSVNDKPINLSNNLGFSTWPSVFSNGNNTIYVGWEDNSTGNYELLFTKSTDGGATFSEPLNLSNNNGTSEDATITELNGTIYVGLSDNTTGNYEVLLTKSTDGGSTFSDPINLSNNTATSADPMIKSSEDNLLITWENNGEIFFTKSRDGLRFDEPVNLSNTNGSSMTPRLSLHGNNNLSVVWEDQTPGNSEVFFSKSTDGGATFSDPINVSDSIDESYYQDVATSANGAVYVVWNEILPDYSDIFYTRSTDGGITFDEPVNLSNSNESGSWEPTIAVSEVDPNMLYIVWDGVDATALKNVTSQASTQLGNSDQNNTMIPRTGVSWQYNLTSNIAKAMGLASPNGALIADVVPGSPAEIAGLKGSNRVAMIDGKAVKLGGDVILRVNDTNIANSGQYNRFIKEAQIGDYLRLTIFREGEIMDVNMTVGSRPADEILLVKSLNGGATFGDPINISNTPMDSYLPRIALSKNNELYVVWEDSLSPGNSEVFFTKR